MDCYKARQSTNGIFQKNWLSRQNTNGAITFDKGVFQAMKEKGKTVHKRRLQRSLQIKDLVFIHSKYTEHQYDKNPKEINSVQNYTGKCVCTPRVTRFPYISVHKANLGNVNIK